MVAFWTRPCLQETMERGFQEKKESGKKEGQDARREDDKGSTAEFGLVSQMSGPETTRISDWVGRPGPSHLLKRSPPILLEL
ncbi:14127_t:CDS:2, partial [Acaulospora colombiana]